MSPAQGAAEFGRCPGATRHMGSRRRQDTAGCSQEQGLSKKCLRAYQLGMRKIKISIAGRTQPVGLASRSTEEIFMPLAAPPPMTVTLTRPLSPAMVADYGGMSRLQPCGLPAGRELGLGSYACGSPMSHCSTAQLRELTNMSTAD